MKKQNYIIVKLLAALRIQTQNTNAKHKYNTVKHLKSCYSVNKNERKVADNKIC